MNTMLTTEDALDVKTRSSVALRLHPFVEPSIRFAEDVICAFFLKRPVWRINVTKTLIAAL